MIVSLRDVSKLRGWIGKVRLGCYRNCGRSLENMESPRLYRSTQASSPAALSVLFSQTPQGLPCAQKDDPPVRVCSLNVLYIPLFSFVEMTGHGSGNGRIGDPTSGDCRARNATRRYPARLAASGSNLLMNLACHCISLVSLRTKVHQVVRWN